MNGGVRLLAVAFLLAFCYQWLIDNNWSDVEEDNYDNQEDFVRKFSESFQTQSSNQRVKGNKDNFKAEFEDLQSRKLSFLRIFFFRNYIHH